MIVLMPETGRITAMRTTVTLDDDLLAKARSYTGLKETSAVLRAALTALVEREAARRLARLGGTMPDLKPVRRRRTEPA
jgi:Arc/MetJ family transcription regulator